MKYAIIARADGSMASLPTPIKNVPKALDTCRRGWPQYEWKSFEIEVESRPQGYKFMNPTLRFSTLHVAKDIKIALMDEMVKFSGKFDVAD